MTIAVCFKCGAFKGGAFVRCPKCGTTPVITMERATSMLLTDHYYETSLLKAKSAEILMGNPPSLDSQQLADMMEMLDSPQGRRMIEAFQAMMPGQAKEDIDPAREELREYFGYNEPRRDQPTKEEMQRYIRRTEEEKEKREEESGRFGFFVVWLGPTIVMYVLLGIAPEIGRVCAIWFLGFPLFYLAYKHLKF